MLNVISKIGKIGLDVVVLNFLVVCFVNAMEEIKSNSCIKTNSEIIKKEYRPVVAKYLYGYNILYSNSSVKDGFC